MASLSPKPCLALSLGIIPASPAAGTRLSPIASARELREVRKGGATASQQQSRARGALTAATSYVSADALDQDGDEDVLGR